MNDIMSNTDSIPVSNSGSFLNFLTTEEGVISSCFVASMLSLSKIDITEHPILSMMFATVGSVSGGTWLNIVAPRNVRPVICAGVIGISCLGLYYKYQKALTQTLALDQGQGQRQESTQEIKSCPRSLVPSKEMSRVSYRVHQFLKNMGPDHMVPERTLTVDLVIKTLEDNREKIDKKVFNALETIRAVLGDPETSIEFLQGIFIHGHNAGYVMIRTGTFFNKNDKILGINISDFEESFSIM